MKKRFFSVLLVLAMCLSMLPVTAHAQANDLLSKHAAVIKDFTLDRDESMNKSPVRCFDGDLFSYAGYKMNSGSLVFKLPTRSNVMRLDLHLRHPQYKDIRVIRDYDFKVLNMETESFEGLNSAQKESVINYPDNWTTLLSVTGNTEDYRTHKIKMKSDGAQIFMLDVKKAADDGTLCLFEVELYGYAYPDASNNEHRMPGYRIEWAEGFDEEWGAPLPEGWTFEDKLGDNAKAEFFITSSDELRWPFCHHGKNALRVFTYEDNANSWLCSPHFRVGPGYKLTFSIMAGSLDVIDYSCDFRDNTEFIEVYAIERGKAPAQLCDTIVTQTYYKNYEIDLSPYAGREIQLAFVHTGPTCASAGRYNEGDTGFMLDCLKVWSPQTESANVIFKIVNGTWDGTDSSDKIVTVPLVDGKGTLRASKVPSGMVPNQGYGKGSWVVEPNLRTDAVLDDMIYIYSFEPLPKSPFVDVHPSNYFFTPVLWAVENGITTGLDDTHFGPGASCTRAQVVSFLWSANGKPAPKSTENPFVDISESKYYFNPVLWAVENGITTGMDDTHFQPDLACTRAQVATFLWSANGKPDPRSDENPFVDVSEDAYYYNAVLWALENGITTGMDDTHFGPDKICTRAHVVSFLWNAAGKPEV